MLFRSGELRVHPCPRCASDDRPCSGQWVGGGAAWEGVGRESPPPNYSVAREGKVARWGWDDACLSWSLPTHGHPLHRPHPVIPRTLPHPTRLPTKALSLSCLLHPGPRGTVGQAPGSVWSSLALAPAAGLGWSPWRSSCGQRATHRAAAVNLPLQPPRPALTGSGSWTGKSDLWGRLSPALQPAQPQGTLAVRWALFHPPCGPGWALRQAGPQRPALPVPLGLTGQWV